MHDPIGGKPTMTIAGIAPNEQISLRTTLTFTSSEPTSDFSPSDVVTSPAGCGSLASSWAATESFTTFVADWTPVGDPAACTLTVPADSYIDIAELGNTETRLQFLRVKGDLETVIIGMNTMNLCVNEPMC
jgi:hypothetical protein